MIDERGIDVSEGLGMCLHHYAECCHQLGWHAEAVSAYQESIPMQRAQVPRDPRQSRYLEIALHDMANSLHALGRSAEADAAAIEALQRIDGKSPKDCPYAPNFSLCFVCQRIVTSDDSINLHVDPSLPLPAMTSNLSQGRKRDRVLRLFRRNRA